MHAELAVLSFLSFVVISIILFYSFTRFNSTIIAMAIWLLICNLVYGIDSILWADNTDIHIPAWCDAMTRVLLAANVALPGSCLGISIDLERVSSSRSIPDDKYTKRTRLIYDTTLCLVIPAFYTSLHLIVQDRRFDIVKEFGCVASIHPSTLSAAIMLIPSTVVCLVVLMFSGRAIYWTCPRTSYEMSQHLAARSSFTLADFRTRLAVTVLITIVSLVTTFVSMVANDTVVPWISWSSTHAKVDVIDVVVDFRGVQSSFAGVFIMSMLFVMTSLIELKKLEGVRKWIPRSVSRLSSRGRSQEILLPAASNTWGSLPRSQFPETPELVSGWDEMLHTKRAIRKAEHRPQPLSIVTFPKGTDKDDETFAADTFRFLTSPQARTLGIRSPTSSSPISLYAPSPSPTLHYSPPFSASLQPQYPKPPPLESLNRQVIEPVPAMSSSIHEAESNLSRRRPSVPDDAVSVISTLYDVPWPLPPTEALPKHATPSRFSTIDGADYPITRALLDQRKSPPVRIASKHYINPRVPPQFNTSIFSSPCKGA